MRAKNRHRNRPPRVDLTPLLDAIFLVVLLLLCAFLHMRVVQAVEVARPVVASSTTALEDPNLLHVTVTEDGRLEVDGREAQPSELTALLRTRTSNKSACLITADRMARHGDVTDVLVAAKQALGAKPTYFEVQNTSE